MSDKRYTTPWTPYLLSAPAVLFVILFLACPLTLLLRLSLCKEAEGRGFYQPGTWTFAGYAALDHYTAHIVVFTVTLACLLAFLSVLLAYPLALFIHRLPPRRKALALVLVLLPKLANALVVIYGLILLLDNAGPINSLLGALGQTEPLTLKHNLIGTIVGELYLILPYSVLLLVIGFDRTDPLLPQAARGLGATSWQTFRRITWPLSIPDVILVGQLSLIWGLGAFLGPQLLGSPQQRTLTVEVYEQAFEYNHWPRAAIAAVLMLATLAMCLLVYVGLTRYPQSQQTKTLIKR
jgi:ABC-type spermidine/putrescine transport system permease subunit I